MYKFVLLFRRVDDPDAIDRFFSESLLPMAEKLPALIKSEINWVKGKPGGESRYCLMVELYFKNEAEFQTSMITEDGIALIQILMPWSEKKIVTWFYADVYDSEGG